MASLPDKIISVFLDRQTTVLGDIEVFTELTKAGIPCNADDVRRQVQALSPALFQLKFNLDGTTEIHVEPKIEICEQFLGSGCQAMAKSCDKLHICRHFAGICSTTNCRFPHDFAKGINRKIIAEHGCQYVEPVLLVKLLRLKKFLSRPSTALFHPNSRDGNTRGRGRGRSRGQGQGRGNRGGRSRRFTPQRFSRALLLQKTDLNRQVDVSFPSSNLSNQIDMQMIVMRLNLRGIKVEETFSESENEHFRRATIQLERLTDIEQLLLSPIVDDIKFKRTKQTVDKRSFLIKTSISNEQDKIEADRINLYIDTLVRDVTHTVTDRSSDSEQIVLIRCDDELDFEKVQSVHQSRPRLFGKDMTFIRTYDCDALSIHWNEEDKSMTVDDLNMIFRSVWGDIFSFNFPTDDYAEVEFIHPDAFNQWISQIDKIEAQFNVTINRIIDNVDDVDDARSSSSSHSIPPQVETRPTSSAGFHHRPCQIKIRLRSDWAMIAAHPKFKPEYKEFIHKELDGDIDVIGEEVTYNGTLPRHIHGPTNEVILEEKTKSFISQFKFWKFINLNQLQIDILRESSATVAFSRVGNNDYIVAAKPQEMYKLKGKISSNRDQPSTPPRRNSTFNFLSKNKSPSTLSLQSEPPDRPTSLKATPSTTSLYRIYAPEQMIMFSIETFEQRLQQYLQETFNVKIIIERNERNDNSRLKGLFVSIKISGQEKDVDDTNQDLFLLFSSIQTKTFDDKTNGDWTKLAEAVEVVQYHLKQADMMCACQQVPPNTVNVSFFGATNPQFGIDEEKLEDLIKNRFQSARMPFDPQSMSGNFAKEWKDVEDQILKRDDYRKNICFSKDSTSFNLFGVPQLVKLFRQNFEQVKNRNNPQSCQITLSEKQLKYLKLVAKTDLNRLEKQYKPPTYDISLARLSRQEFLAPPDMHSRLKESLLAIAQVCETSFEINEPGFEVVIDKEGEKLLTLVKDKCVLEKTIDTRRIHIPIPKAQVTDVEDGEKQARSACATSVTVAHSTITISSGDLTAQAVDAIVACSSSTILCKKVIERAGDPVQKEYLLLKASDDLPNMTSNGALPCKKIFFIPWSPKSREENDVKSSLSAFISTAFTYAAAAGYKSIAFPAVGCGRFNFSPSLIAKYMLNETRQQLLGCATKMKVFFVLLPTEQTVYDAFIQRLNEMQAVNPLVSLKSPPTKKDDHSTIDYDQKTVKITLISCNEQHLTKCKQDILNLAHSFSTKSEITQSDMLEWSQETIYKFYEFCFKHRVIPTFDQSQVKLKLVGYKDAVNEAEKYFYQMTSETLKEQRLHAVSRGVVWSVESAPNSDTWEQYSFKINGLIEDAHIKNQPYVVFENDQKQKCRIDFSAMVEHNEYSARRVRRKLVDSVLPSTWSTLANQNCKRVVLLTSSAEYQQVLAQFDSTMHGKYAQIVKIERIQNESWYKQYAAHRDDFKRRYPQLDERSLFHGCPSTSADQIIDKCFNRSFAGVNGIAFGCGVYFHAQASYSHQFAAMNNPAEKMMFLARVLIGKTCKGDKSMKVVPPGYDTTTDGQHIFVVYHDAGAYADHLITYK